MTNLPSILKSKDITLLTKKGPYSQGHGFSSSHVQMWELDHKEGWVPQNWCFQIVVLGKILESPVDSKIKPVSPKGNKFWLFIGRSDVETEAPVLWPLDVKSLFIGKDPDTGEIDGKRRRGWKRVRWLVSITDLMDMSLSKLQEMVKNSEAWRAAVHGVAKSQTWPSDWTTTSLIMATQSWYLYFHTNTDCLTCLFLYLWREMY